MKYMNKKTALLRMLVHTFIPSKKDLYGICIFVTGFLTLIMIVWSMDSETENIKWFSLVYALLVGCILYKVVNEYPKNS